MTVNSIGSSYLEEKSGNTHKNTKRLTGDFRLHGRFPNANRKIYLPETATGLR